MTDTITMTLHELDRQKQEAYFKGLYDGIIAAEKNRQASRADAVEALVYDETIASFLAGTGRF